MDRTVGQNMKTHVHPATPPNSRPPRPAPLAEIWVPFEKQLPPDLHRLVETGPGRWEHDWEAFGIHGALDHITREECAFRSPIQPGDEVVLEKPIMWDDGSYIPLTACFTAGESTPKQRECDGKWGWLVELERKETGG